VETNQKTLFDAIRERDEAIAQIATNTSDTFKDCARSAVINVGRMRQHFTSDDIWNWLETHKSIEAHDNRALGAVMSKLHKEHLIMPTGQYIPSKRRHMSPIRVWTMI
jgi:hypothetical protein